MVSLQMLIKAEAKGQAYSHPDSRALAVSQVERSLQMHMIAGAKHTHMCFKDAQTFTPAVYMTWCIDP
jgi:hypothetical protein